MIIFKKSSGKNIQKILKLYLVLMLLQSCHAYKSSTSLEQASLADEKGFIKVTLVNGDEYIYESVEITDGKYYGVKTVNGETEKTTLLKEDVLKAERQNKISSGFFSLVGIAIGVVSVMFAVLMF